VRAANPILHVLFWSVSLLGCATGPSQLGEAAGTPPKEVATIQGVSGFMGTELETVDGKIADEDQVKLLPGWHDIGVSRSGCDCRFKILAVAGHAYEISTSCSPAKILVADFSNGTLTSKAEVAGTCE